MVNSTNNSQQTSIICPWGRETGCYWGFKDCCQIAVMCRIIRPTNSNTRQYITRHFWNAWNELKYASVTYCRHIKHEYLGINTHSTSWISITSMKLNPSHLTERNEYHKTSNISRTLVGNKIVDHSDVVGASPVSAAPTTSLFLTWHLTSGDLANKATRQYKKCWGFVSYIRDLTV